MLYHLYVLKMYKTYIVCKTALQSQRVLGRLKSVVPSRLPKELDAERVRPGWLDRPWFPRHPTTDRWE